MMHWHKMDIAEAQRLADQGLNVAAIAKRLGYTRAAIYGAARDGRLRIELEARVPSGKPPGKKAKAKAKATVTVRRRGRKIDPERLALLVRQGLSTAQIAAQFGVNRPAVIRACHNAGLPLPGTIEATAPLPEPLPSARQGQSHRARNPRHRGVTIIPPQVRSTRKAHVAGFPQRGRRIGEK